MSEYEVRCPKCNGIMEKRKFVDGGFMEGKPAVFSWEWWCPACRLKWMDFEDEPEEAEG